MPTYQYACTECGHEFDAVQSFSDDALTQCPECGGRLRKVFSAVGVVFKGSGFYRNDSRAASNGAAKDGKDRTEGKDGKDRKDGKPAKDGANPPSSSSETAKSGSTTSGSSGSKESGSSSSAGSSTGSKPSSGGSSAA